MTTRFLAPSGISGSGQCCCHLPLERINSLSNRRPVASAIYTTAPHRAQSSRRLQQPLWTHRHFHSGSSLLLCRAAEEEEVDVETDAMERMETAVKVAKEKFGSLRTGRASPNLLDLVKVEYYGAPTPLRSLANISAPEASLLVVSPFDKDKAVIENIEKAIMSANLGLTPGNDGKLIRINVPQLTADRRKEMSKQVSKLGEEGKVAIRNVRRDAMKKLDQQEKAGDLSEDEREALGESIQEITDDSIKQIDEAVKSKQADLTSM
ncbi:hypothetical protein WJX73_009054 [Symbiochloris irregularis]|uniref:Ribosome-recycling factor, chloroplastic n=1 Tax=Symbiochloris irregularis TaxID=706552 RepID=A0AAW1PE23_9CHLO